MSHSQLETVFRQVFGDEDLAITDHTTANDIPGWDSVAHINLMFTIEQTFGIQFIANELAEAQDVGGLKQLISRKRAA